MNDYDNGYTLIKDYHGDIKVINKSTKKVNLSKSTDTLDHKSKQSLMPTIYTKSFKNTIKKRHNKRICLTKPKDFENKKKQSYEQYRVKPSQAHQQLQSNNIPPIHTNKINHDLTPLIRLIPLILIKTDILFKHLELWIPIISVTMSLKAIKEYKNQRITKEERNQKLFKWVAIPLIILIFLGVSGYI